MSVPAPSHLRGGPLPFLVFLPPVLFSGKLLLPGKKGPRPWRRGEGGLPAKETCLPQAEGRGGLLCAASCQRSPAPALTPPPEGGEAVGSALDPTPGEQRGGRTPPLGGGAT